MFFYCWGNLGRHYIFRPVVKAGAQDPEMLMQEIPPGMQGLARMDQEGRARAIEWLRAAWQLGGFTILSPLPLAR